MTLDELEIIKSALEGDIIRQKQSENNHPAFQKWLADTEKLYKKITNELITRKAKIKILENINY